MRKSIDGLTAIVKESFGMDTFAASLFLFCGKKRDRLKALLWKGDGIVLLYKRLKSGYFKWPRRQEQARQITMKEFGCLMEGLEIDQPKAIRNIKPGGFC